MSKLRQVTDLDLRLLRSFAEIVDRGGFAAAQSSLNISQSVMSEHLKTLEVRLGFTLCKRGPGGFKLLPEGEEVYRAAKKLFGSIDEFKEEVGEISTESAGEIIVAIEDEVINNPRSRVAQALETFTRQVGRRVRFRIESMAGYLALSRVADGSAHVGISVSDVRTRDTYMQRLFDEEVFLYCSSGHPLFGAPDETITPESLLDQPYSSRGHLELRDLAALTHGFSGNDVGLGAQAQLMLVLSGRDLGYLPSHLAAPFVAQGMLRPVRPDLTKKVIPVNVVTRDGGAHFKLVAGFRACLLAAHSADADGRQYAQPEGSKNTN